MPLTYTLDNGVLRFFPVGEVPHTHGLAIIAKALEEARTQGEAQGIKAWHVFFDLRELTDQPTPDIVQGLAMAFAQHADILSGRMSSVTSTLIQEGLSQMFVVFAKQIGQQAKTCKTVEEAEAFLTQSSTG